MAKEIINVEFIDDIVKADMKGLSAKAYKIPRLLVKSLNLVELDKKGIYFLFCENDDGSKGVYIGESVKLRNRLITHINDYENGKELYYWNTVVFIYSEDFNEDDLHYLEDKLFKEAYAINNISKKFEIYTQTTRNTENFKEYEMLNKTIEVTKKYIEVFGFGDVYKTIEKYAKPSTLKSDNSSSNENYNQCETLKNNPTYFCERNGSRGIGHYSNGGFVVHKESKVGKMSLAFEKSASGYCLLRKELENKGIIKEGMFAYDYEFNSPSAAASVLIGNSANGKDQWKIFNGDMSSFLTDKTNIANKRKTRFKFDLVGINPGEILTFANDESIKVIVHNNSSVEYEGKIWELSPLAKELLHKKSNPQGPAFFKYKGVILTKLRKHLGK